MTHTRFVPGTMLGSIATGAAALLLAFAAVAAPPAKAPPLPGDSVYQLPLKLTDQQARTFDKGEAEARDAALAASRKTMRINSLEIEEVTVADGRIVPYRLRERIRAEGPTAGGDIADRQHLGEDGHVSI